MASNGANVNDFLFGQDNGEGQGSFSRGGV
jgi:hypothetical protein